jgi:hypothetical protein
MLNVISEKIKESRRASKGFTSIYMYPSVVGIAEGSDTMELFEALG